MILLSGNQNRAYLDKDTRDMTKDFAGVFTDEVETENGFTHGGKSYIVAGNQAVWDCEIAVASLLRGDYATYRATPMEVVRRLRGVDNPLATFSELHAHLRDCWESAECFFIFDFFDDEAAEARDQQDNELLVWFIRQAVTSGNVVVLPTKGRDVDLNLYGVHFGAFIEQSFEVIHDEEKKSRKRK